MNVRVHRMALWLVLAGITILGNTLYAAPDYAAVHEIFQKQCADCHDAQEPEADLDLESYKTFMKGGKGGSALVSGNAQDSLIIKFLEGRSGKEGKNKFMPPGKRDHLPPAQITLIRAWIDAGAKPPAKALASRRELHVPDIAPRTKPHMAIKSIAWSEPVGMYAVARYGEVELYMRGNPKPKFTLTGHTGSVNAVAFSKDGKYLYAAAGQTGLFGEVRQWEVATGKLVHTFEGHADSIYAVAVSPDGKVLGTGSYDHLIILWDIASGKPLRTLKGHNGCVYDLDFRPDGRIIASASADRTVKLWDVATGERRDTLSQSTKEVYSVVFSPDGKRLASAGVDNRIRVWEISNRANETTNPLLYSRYGHEGAILNLAFSPDGKWLLSTSEDQTAKLWDFGPMKETLLLEKQPDWAPGIAFMSSGQEVVLGRLDGSIGIYDTATGAATKDTQKLSQVQVKP